LPKITIKSPKNLFLISSGAFFLAITALSFLQWHSSPNTDIAQDSNQNNLQQLDNAKLIPLANSPVVSIERSRARYLLAVNFLQKYKGGEALKELDNLDRDYPLLQPYIWLKQGRAYQLINDNNNALKTWLKVTQIYQNSSIAADALYSLNAIDPKYGNQLIKQYPFYSLTWDLIQDSLKRNPNQPNLLKILVQYDPSVSTQILSTLTQKYSTQLSAKDWENIARAYARQENYKASVLGYNKAPKTSTNLLALANVYELSGNIKLARSINQKIVQKFPHSAETSKALLRLVEISPRQEKINYLNKIIKQYGELAPDALKNKGQILETQGNTKDAEKVYSQLLKQYPKTNAAADYRWIRAYIFARKGNLKEASNWARSILEKSPDTQVAPKASFWLGKWSKQLGNNQQAIKFFKITLNKYPQSYYAWRSAVNLGADVGDFTNLVRQNVLIDNLFVMAQPTAGSQLFKELYRLGQLRDARALYEQEIKDKKSLSVNEVYTQSLLSEKNNQYLLASNALVSLKKRTSSKDRSELNSLRETLDYWHTLFPLPYQDLITKNAADNNLNSFLVRGLIRQESGYESAIKSPVGALGLMQIMPSTADWIANKLKTSTYSLINPNDNIKLGTWYLNYVSQQYRDDSLLAVASYNAGPGNVTKWLKTKSLSDHDVFVEEIPFKETKNYVESVLANYWNYLRLYNLKTANWLKKNK